MPYAAAVGTPVDSGSMSCYPRTGAAKNANIVVGWQDSGTYELRATGVFSSSSGLPCLFEIKARTNSVTWSGGTGTVAPAVNVGCTAGSPGDSCVTTSSFAWTRPVHGVAFDVPYDLSVNDVNVASGTFHFYDPPKAVVDLLEGL
jgi:hypothetical protein